MDGNPRKKKALIDFLLCLPENLEAVLKKKHIQQSFVDAGMIDEETKMVPCLTGSWEHAIAGYLQIKILDFHGR